MNSFETLTLKQLDETENNLLKQLERIKSERKLRLKASEKENCTSLLKISLFSKKDKEEKEEKEKPVKEKKEKSIKIKKDDDNNKKPREIKATIASMKEVLKYHNVNFASNAKKDELSQLLREHNLVREAEKKEAIKKEE